MSQVIKNILARKGMKGPFNDGRKIGLVLPGGCMTGAIGAGAVTALEDLQLTYAFDFIYTTSAGFPNASCFLSGNMKFGSSVYYEGLKNRRFINFLKFWKPIDFERVVNVIRDIKAVDCKKLWECETEVFLKVDKKFNSPEFIKLKDCSPLEYFDILKTSIFFPYISKGGIIKKKKYFDGAITDKDHDDFILNAVRSDYTDLLIIYNQKRQKLFGISFSEDILEITPDNDISIFETNPRILKEACDKMEKKVLEVFNTK